MNLSSLFAVSDFPRVDCTIFFDFAMRTVDDAIEQCEKLLNNLGSEVGTEGCCIFSRQLKISAYVHCKH